MLVKFTLDHLQLIITGGNMNLLTQVQKTIRDSLNNIIPIRKAMNIAAGRDIFILVSTNQTYQSVNYNNQNQMGNFTFQFLLVPEPSINLPADTFGTIFDYFRTNTIMEFGNNGVQLHSYDVADSELVTDPSTGYQSLSFAINIVATLK